MLLIILDFGRYSWHHIRMKNYKLTVSYDGGRYRGFQRQSSTAATIQGKLESALSGILDQNVEIAASGRTDAGVHAAMQVCSFRAETALSCDEVLSALRRYLPEDISALTLEETDPRFHARLNCRTKTYAYTLRTAEVQDVFRRDYEYHLPCSLNIKDMRAAAALLTGEHDFRAFTSEKRIKKSTVRTVYSIDIVPSEETVVFICRGNGFLYNMVRIIVGTLIEVGRGDRSPESVRTALDSLERENAGFTAPAKGLTLESVEY